MSVASNTQIGRVYLIHFDEPFSHARHYSGFTTKYSERMWHHRKGTGSNLLRHVNNAGIKYITARVWDGVTRDKEKQLKNHGGARYCPVCQHRAFVCFDCHKVYKYKGWFKRHRRLKHGAE